MITAQDLYDRRDETGEISGNDLHEIFEAICGDPSPAGRTPISRASLAAHAQRVRANIVQDPVGSQEAIAQFCESLLDDIADAQVYLSENDMLKDD
jgi:hypothetical protein